MVVVVVVVVAQQYSGIVAQFEGFRETLGVLEDD